jgi:hypothetical protein
MASVTQSPTERISRKSTYSICGVEWGMSIKYEMINAITTFPRNVEVLRTVLNARER